MLDITDADSLIQYHNQSKNYTILYNVQITLAPNYIVNKKVKRKKILIKLWMDELILFRKIPAAINIFLKQQNVSVSLLSRKEILEWRFLHLLDLVMT